MWIQKHLRSCLVGLCCVFQWGQVSASSSSLEIGFACPLTSLGERSCAQVSQSVRFVSCSLRDRFGTFPSRKCMADGRRFSNSRLMLPQILSRSSNSAPDPSQQAQSLRSADTGTGSLCELNLFARLRQRVRSICKPGVLRSWRSTHSHRSERVRRLRRTENESTRECSIELE